MVRMTPIGMATECLDSCPKVSPRTPFVSELKLGTQGTDLMISQLTLAHLYINHNLLSLGGCWAWSFSSRAKFIAYIWRSHCQYSAVSSMPAKPKTTWYRKKHPTTPPTDLTDHDLDNLNPNLPLCDTAVCAESV